MPAKPLQPMSSAEWLRTPAEFAIAALLPFHPLGMALAIFAAVVLCSAARIPSHGRLAVITVLVAMAGVLLWPEKNGR
jgi:hypothetical protein